MTNHGSRWIIKQSQISQCQKGGPQLPRLSTNGWTVAPPCPGRTADLPKSHRGRAAVVPRSCRGRTEVVPRGS